MIRVFSLVIALAATGFFLNTARADNVGGRVYLQQVMVGAQPTMTGTAFAVFSSGAPIKYYALSADQGQASTTFDARLQGSLDGLNWNDLAITSSVVGIQFQSSPRPVNYLRLQGVTLASGKIITATAIGIP